MLKAIITGGLCAAAGATWALTAVAAESPETATKARQNMTSQASGVVGSLGQFGGNTVYSSSFVVSGATRGLQNTGIANVFGPPTTVAGGSVPPPVTPTPTP